MFCRTFKRIDLYGKEPEFYYKNNPNKTSWIGRIFTFLYLGVYIAFFIYKIVRMAKRKDVTFYDTNSNGGEIPSIHLDKELFNAALAFDNISSNIPYINEKIYTISGKYIVQTKENGIFKTSENNIEFKNCQISDFGSNYQNIMAKKNISQMLCPQNVDFVLEGYYTMEKYSYIKVNFQRCVNTTENNNHCFPPDQIENSLNITRINTKLQDIELTPQDYENPVRYQEREISGTSFRGLLPQITVEMQIVIIETDNNIIGFEGLSNSKIDKYLKYDSVTINAIPITSVISTPETSMNLNEIKIQLSSNILYQKRAYTQLIDVLGDVGGLMEIMNMIFNVITYLIVNILYNKSLVNNLFNFDLNKKLVLLKNKNIDKIIDMDIKQNDNNENKEIFQKNKTMKKWSPKKINLQVNKPYYEGINKSSRRTLNDIYEDKRKNIFKNHATTIIEDKYDKYDKKASSKVVNNNYQLNLYKNNLEKEKYIIKKIRTDKICIYYCFCFINHCENISNILLDEGMKIIYEQLDIFNIFRRLFEISKLDNMILKGDIKNQMSDECKQRIRKIIHKILSF